MMVSVQNYLPINFMTILGFIFLICCLYCYFQKPIQYLMGLVLFSCIFQASSIINIGGKGIPPYLFVEFFLVCKAIPYFFSDKKLKFNRIFVSFYLFTCLSIVLTLFMPFLFEGKKVTIPGGKTSDEYLAMMQLCDKLYFSSKNIIQILFLLSNGITLYIFYLFRNKLTDEFTIKIFINSVYCVLIVGVWGYLNKIANIPFPNDIFYSNVGYGQLYNVGNDLGLFRLNSTFSEPSYCGSFLASSFWGIYALNRYKFLYIPIIIALALNLSSTGIVVFIIGFVFNAITSKKHFFIFFCSFIILFLIVYNSSFWEYIDFLLLSKSETLSGMARTNSLILTIALCKETYFLGLGLGSHRDFTFLGNTLAAVGLLGTIIFLYNIYQIQKNNYSNRKSSNASLFLYHWGNIHWIAVFIALPDLSYSVIWMWMFASLSQYQYKTIQYANRN